MTATFSTVGSDPSPDLIVEPSVAELFDTSVSPCSATLSGLGAGPAAHAAPNPDRRHPARQRTTICPQCGRRAGRNHYRDTGALTPCPDWACPTLHAQRNRTA